MVVKRSWFTILAIVLIVLVLLSFALYDILKPANYLKYPKVRRDEKFVNYYHGYNISDPYQWMENLESTETRDFIKQQNQLTQNYLRDAPNKGKILETLRHLDELNYLREGAPIKRGNRTFISTVSGSQFYFMETTNYSENNTPNWTKIFNIGEEEHINSTMYLIGADISFNGDIMIYILSRSGSDWNTIHLRNISSRQDFPEVLHNIRNTGIAWSQDSTGFFYTRFDGANRTSELDMRHSSVGVEKLYFHIVGTEQSDDRLMAEFPQNPGWTFNSIEITQDFKYLIIDVGLDYHLAYLFIAILTDDVLNVYDETQLEVYPLITEPAIYLYVANDDTTFYFVTDHSAPNTKIISLEFSIEGSRNSTSWNTIIPENETRVLIRAIPTGRDKMMITYLERSPKIAYSLELHSLQNGSTLTATFLDLDGFEITSEQGERADNDFYFELRNFTHPGSLYHINVETSEIKLFSQVDLSLENICVPEVIVSSVLYKSKDDTIIPMTIVHRKDLVLDGKVPTLLTGYGGFGIIEEIKFATDKLFFVTFFNGIVAYPRLRGGGDFGNKWWEYGRHLHKQNTFDDFIAAAEYLIDSGYTIPSKLTIQGGSNGGLLIGACITQRPELFGAAIAEVGLFDMFRFQHFTWGPSWCGEYGCSHNKTEFEHLMQYSPLHNVNKSKSGHYPAVLVATGDHDDRVPPFNSYKFIAELQYKLKNQKNPLLLYVGEDVGHSTVDTAGAIMQFLSKILG